MTQTLRAQAEATIAAYVEAAAAAGRPIDPAVAGAMVEAEIARLANRSESRTFDPEPGDMRPLQMSRRGLERLLGREISDEEYSAAQAISREELQRQAAGLDESKCRGCAGSGLVRVPTDRVPPWRVRVRNDDGTAIADCLDCPVDVRRARNLSGTLPPEDYTAARFETFRFSTGNRKHAEVLARLQRWAAHDIEVVTPFLILSGPVGVGKTHLAKAIALVRAERGERVRWSTAAGMLEAIQATFDTEDDRERERFNRKRWASLPTLVIDDLGAEQPTEWRRMTIEHLLADRYEHNRPTVITTNLTLDEIAERHGDGYGRLVSRLADGATARRTTYIEMAGKDWRRA